MGFTPREPDHAECGDVYISANPITPYLQLQTLGQKTKQNRHGIFSKKSNLEEKPQSSYHYKEQCQVHALKEDHAQPGWTTSIHGQNRVNQNDRGQR